MISNTVVPENVLEERRVETRQKALRMDLMRMIADAERRGLQLEYIICMLGWVTGFTTQRLVLERQLDDDDLDDLMRKDLVDGARWAKRRHEAMHQEDEE